MDKNNTLSKKSCVPCNTAGAALTQVDIDHGIAALKNTWSVNTAGHLYQSYAFPNFIQAMHFANKIADIAEEAGHHPDVTISYGRCAVEIWTHRINGLTESDFILAAKINQLHALLPA